MARVLLAIAFLLSCIASTSASRPCYRKCRFFFCDGKTEFKVGIPDKPFTGAICSKFAKIGVIGRTDEAFLFKSGKLTKISELDFEGLEQKFAPSFFKSYTISGKERSGVGHEVPQTNQAKFLDRKCWVLHIIDYQILNKEGNVIKNVHTHRRDDCIAFKTKL